MKKIHIEKREKDQTCSLDSWHSFHVRLESVHFLFSTFAKLYGRTKFIFFRSRFRY